MSSKNRTFVIVAFQFLQELFLAYLFLAHIANRAATFANPYSVGTARSAVCAS